MRARANEGARARTQKARARTQRARARTRACGRGRASVPTRGRRKSATPRQRAVLTPVVLHPFPTHHSESELRDKRLAEAARKFESLSAAEEKEFLAGKR